jgi:uncharacterized protein with HEPN domain
MQRDPASFLWDARQAADAVIAFTRGRTGEDLQKDLLLRSAVERQMEIIGEALSQLSRLNPALARQVPDLSRIIGLRNILVHGYAQVDPARVWRIIQENLPELRATLDRLLGEAPPPGHP